MTANMTDDKKEMTLGEFADSCDLVCDALHELINNHIDDETDPMGYRKAIVAQYLKYILHRDILTLLGAT